MKGDLPALLREAGFVGVVETGYARTLYGTLARLCARRPA